VALLRLLHRWRDEAVGKGRAVTRIAVAFEAGRDGFWLARWLTQHGIEVHVIHSSSVAVSREHKRAKTDRLDTAMLMRVFLGWLRGERGHCGMVAVPTIEEEDAKRPNRERENLVGECTRIITRMKSALARLILRMQCCAACVTHINLNFLDNQVHTNEMFEVPTIFGGLNSPLIGTAPIFDHNARALHGLINNLVETKPTNRPCGSMKTSATNSRCLRATPQSPAACLPTSARRPGP